VTSDSGSGSGSVSSSEEGEVDAGQAEAMGPHGAALLAYVRGDAAAELRIRRDDGLVGVLPAAQYFREPAAFTASERSALEACRGQVLDVGAGTGLHSLELQARGFRVTAIDISAVAVEIMRERGVAEARCADVWELEDEGFDTLLMLGHGIGMVETLAGLDRYLAHARGLTRPGGQVLLDSTDVTRTSEPLHLAYHEANRRAGRYVGETRMQLEYAGSRGPFCGWLHVDPATLGEHARRAGWSPEVLLEGDTGEYLARLQR